MIHFHKPLRQKKYYRLNQSIFAKEVRVVDEKGKQVGILPLTEAIGQAREKNLDLVEIAPKAKPPVCKIINFKKFLFLEAKKEAQEKKKSKKTAIKEVQLSPFIAQNDFDFRVGRTKEFLAKGNKVKVAVMFKGRQMDKKDFGYQLIERLLEKLKSEAEIDLAPKFLGRRLELVLKPKGEKK